MEKNWKIANVSDLSQKMLDRVDDFILSNYTNGEFINTIKYLSYHKTRFVDDSLVVLDTNSLSVLAVLLGSKKDNAFISHPGTTFAGFIYDNMLNFEKLEIIFNEVFDHVESIYQNIYITNRPNYYSSRIDEKAEYLLLKRGYCVSIKDYICAINLNKCIDDSDDSILNIYNSKRRNEVRKALKENSFDFYFDSNISKNVWDNMNANLKDKYNSKTVHSFEEITNLKSIFPNSVIPYYVKEKKTNEYAAFGLIYKYKNAYHAQYLDMNYNLSKKYPNLILIHNIIKQAKQNGINIFCFGGITTGENKDINYGLFNYKNDFGSENFMLVTYSKTISER